MIQYVLYYICTIFLSTCFPHRLVLHREHVFPVTILRKLQVGCIQSISMLGSDVPFRYEELGTDICNLKSFPQTAGLVVAAAKLGAPGASRKWTSRASEKLWRNTTSTLMAKSEDMQTMKQEVVYVVFATWRSKCLVGWRPPQRLDKLNAAIRIQVEPKIHNAVVHVTGQHLLCSKISWSSCFSFIFKLRTHILHSLVQWLRKTMAAGGESSLNVYRLCPPPQFWKEFSESSDSSSNLTCRGRRECWNSSLTLAPFYGERRVAGETGNWKRLCFIGHFRGWSRGILGQSCLLRQMAFDCCRMRYSDVKCSSSHQEEYKKSCKLSPINQNWMLITPTRNP